MPAPALSAAAARPSLADPRRALTRFAAPAEVTSPSTDVHSPSLLGSPRRGRRGGREPPKAGGESNKGAGWASPSGPGGPRRAGRSSALGVVGLVPGGTTALPRIPGPGRVVAGRPVRS